MKRFGLLALVLAVTMSATPLLASDSASTRARINVKPAVYHPTSSADQLNITPVYWRGWYPSYYGYGYGYRPYASYYRPWGGYYNYGYQPYSSYYRPYYGNYWGNYYGYRPYYSAYRPYYSSWWY